ncbi:diguanylate cyclase [Thermovirga lienii]|uniref:GGDEF domain-containing response regulator n=1 Tax=Thermovirga lienii TaxID=336261 RepID=UPI002FE212A3
MIEVERETRGQIIKKVLLVEDTPFYVRIVENLLPKDAFIVITVPSGEEAIKRVFEDKDIAIVLMDVVLSGQLDGIKTAQEILKVRDIPILFLTSSTDPKTLVRINSSGAYGYIPKGTEGVSLLSNVNMALKLHETRLKLKEKEATLRAIVNIVKDGILLLDQAGRVLFLNPAAEKIFGYTNREARGKGLFSLLEPEWILDVTSGDEVKSGELEYSKHLEGKELEVKFKHKREERPIFVDMTFSLLKIEERSYYVVAGKDVTKHKELQEKLLYLSITDPLTGAYNRRYTEQRLQEEMERSKRMRTVFSVIMFDLDHFKRVNDEFGHDIGDEVLKRVTDVVKRRIRKIDTLGRWGGEEFLVILPGTTLEKAVFLAEELRKKIEQEDMPFDGNCTASFGVTAFLEGESGKDLIKRADEALYKAKNEGRNCVRYAIY